MFNDPLQTDTYLIRAKTYSSIKDLVEGKVDTIDHGEFIEAIVLGDQPAAEMLLSCLCRASKSLVYYSQPNMETV